MSEAIKKMYAKNLVDGSATPDGYVSMTTGEILEVAQYIAEMLLPRVEFKSGQQSNDYRMFFLAVNICLRCVEQSEQLERIERKFHLQSKLLKYTQQQLTEVEEELQKYLTVDKLIQSGAMDNVIKIVQHQKFDFIKEALAQLKARQSLSG